MTLSDLFRTELFCDDNPDCVDGSDENLCGPRNDPNRAQSCDNQICKVTIQSDFCYLVLGIWTLLSDPMDVFVKRS
jgi:hypothetical protein